MPDILNHKTQLSPLHETLFQSWAKAHRVDNHDDPNNAFDYRGVYSRTNGMIHPPGHLNQMAAEHNAAANQETPAGGAAIDPAMAAVEHQKNQADAQAKEREQALKLHLLERGHQQKLELKNLELNHKSAEAEKQRSHLAQQDQISRAHDVQQGQLDRQNSLQDVLMQRQHALQDQATQRQNDVADQAAGAQSDLHGKVLAEHLTRTRSKPTPTQAQPTPTTTAS